MNKPTGAFAIAIAGGSLSMIGLTYYYPYNYLALTLTNSITSGLVVTILAILFHEMPERKLSFGGAIIAISIAQLGSSAAFLIADSAGLTYFSNGLVLILIPMVGSTLSLLGGVAAVRWKDRANLRST